MSHQRQIQQITKKIDKDFASTAPDMDNTNPIAENLKKINDRKQESKTDRSTTHALLDRNAPPVENNTGQKIAGMATTSQMTQDPSDSTKQHQNCTKQQLPQT